MRETPNDAGAAAEPDQVEPRRQLLVAGGRVGTMQRLAAMVGGGIEAVATAPNLAAALHRMGAASRDAAASFKHLLGLVQDLRSRRPKRGRVARNHARRRAVRNAMATASRRANWPRWR